MGLWQLGHRGSEGALSIERPAGLNTHSHSSSNPSISKRGLRTEALLHSVREEDKRNKQSLHLSVGKIFWKVDLLPGSKHSESPRSHPDAAVVSMLQSSHLLTSCPCPEALTARQRPELSLTGRCSKGGRK